MASFYSEQHPTRVFAVGTVNDADGLDLDLAIGLDDRMWRATRDLAIASVVEALGRLVRGALGRGFGLLDRALRLLSSWLADASLADLAIDGNLGLVRRGRVGLFLLRLPVRRLGVFAGATEAGKQLFGAARHAKPVGSAGLAKNLRERHWLVGAERLVSLCGRFFWGHFLEHHFFGSSIFSEKTLPCRCNLIPNGFPAS